MEDKRTTSHAKGVEFDSYQETALDREAPLSPNFNDQSGEQYQGYEQEQSGGSEMVKQDAPTNDNRPPPEIARAQDRETFNEKWTEEQQRAALEEEYLKGALEAYEQEPDINHGPDRGYDHDFER